MKKYSFAKFMLIIVILSIPLYLMASALNTTKDLNNFYEEIVNIQNQLNGLSQSLYIADQKGESSTSLRQSLSVYNAKIKNLNLKIFDYAANNDISSINKIRLETLIIAIELLNDLNLILNELSINKDYEIEYKLFKSFFSTNELLTQSLSAFPL
ncbi:hypothetical protein [Zhenhengia yiwuensis]|uniref:Uncharacterized protein n=1 Tax=Zhenhengia yiwuensis TaxID=2763666 RepID=A0A926EP89_9FIRM|nr:hypothetical protein [Zhenhengia yiwuensis]MBC8581658.1 hypothetical protein [Zhenhengia yiwuensis]MDY3360835.1 hypothetical protein [Clostridium celatum]